MCTDTILLISTGQDSDDSLSHANEFESIRSSSFCTLRIGGLNGQLCTETIFDHRETHLHHVILTSTCLDLYAPPIVQQPVQLNWKRIVAFDGVDVWTRPHGICTPPEEGRQCVLVELHRHASTDCKVHL